MTRNNRYMFGGCNIAMGLSLLFAADSIATILFGAVTALFGFLLILFAPAKVTTKVDHMKEIQSEYVRDFSELRDDIIRTDKRPLNPKYYPLGYPNYRVVTLPIEWEAAMADEAPPLDPAFLNAAKESRN